MAEQVSASFFANSRPIVTSIKTWIFPKETDGIKSLSGGFTIPPEVWIPPGGPFQMVLADGRKGDVLFTRVGSVKGKEPRAEFTSTGPFG